MSEHTTTPSEGAELPCFKFECRNNRTWLLQYGQIKQQLEEWIDSLRTRLAAAERDHVETLQEINTVWIGRQEAMQREIATLRAQVTVLRDGFDEYAWHNERCNFNGNEDTSCDCGFLDVRTALAGESVPATGEVEKTAPSCVRDANGDLILVERTVPEKMVRDVALFMVRSEPRWSTMPGRDCLREVWSLACQLRAAYCPETWTDDSLITEARGLVQATAATVAERGPTKIQPWSEDDGVSPMFPSGRPTPPAAPEPEVAKPDKATFDAAYYGSWPADDATDRGPEPDESVTVQP